jgi:uncharacterized protein
MVYDWMMETIRVIRDWGKLMSLTVGALRAPLVFMICILAIAVPGARAGHISGGGLTTFSTDKLTIETASGPRAFRIEVARSGRQQAQGLMYRRRLAADAGMLFVYRRTQVIEMWMRNTFIPLDMLFIASNGRIAHIAERTTPQSLETISSREKVNFVLELNAGTVARLKIKIGDRVRSPALGG